MQYLNMKWFLFFVILIISSCAETQKDNEQRNGVECPHIIRRQSFFCEKYAVVSQVYDTISRAYRIVFDIGDDKYQIDLPPASDYNNFAVQDLRRTDSGLELIISFGSRYTIDKYFHFECKDRNFVLTSVITVSIDNHNPEKDAREWVIYPDKPFADIGIMEYLDDY